MILSNGVYLDDTHVCPEESEDVLAAVIRSRRNRLLEESDKYMLPDYPLTDEERLAWQEYRSRLRDIPSQEGFPHDVVFPEVH
ncbi:MAG: phage tail assembly chaperone [Clostridia bacterium]|nr:phage tail assembly chaperone [Clostridia bacterium]